MRKYAISVVVVRGLKRGERRDTIRVRQGLHAIRMVARRQSIAIVTLSGDRLRRFFREYDRCTRYETAQLLAKAFPELRWALPPARKFYGPEDRRMALFDAVALGIAYLGTATDHPDRVHTLLTSGVAAVGG
jgi:hypothetical protein